MNKHCDGLFLNYLFSQVSHITFSATSSDTLYVVNIELSFNTKEISYSALQYFSFYFHGQTDNNYISLEINSDNSLTIGFKSGDVNISLNTRRYTQFQLSDIISSGRIIYDDLHCLAIIKFNYLNVHEPYLPIQSRIIDDKLHNGFVECIGARVHVVSDGGHELFPSVNPIF